MKLHQADDKAVQQLWKQVEAGIGASRFAEDAAQVLASGLHRQFDDSVVIARVFMTQPFGKLPSPNQDFVRQLASSKGAADALKPVTPVLSLIGTSGKKPAWCERRKSEGHVGIPLISAEFVGAIPMIARLLNEIGIPLQWVDTADTEELVRIVGGTAGLFYVDDASKAVDQEGRKVIAAQDFVAANGVKTVFGACDAYDSGQIVVLVVFASDEIERNVAEAFIRLMPRFKDATKSLVAGGKIFSS